MGGLVEKETQDKTDNMKKLMATMEFLKGLHADCDWLLQNFDVRKEARAGEVEALKKAKAVLSGADFSLLQISSRQAPEDKLALRPAESRRERERTQYSCEEPLPLPVPDFLGSSVAWMFGSTPPDAIVTEPRSLLSSSSLRTASWMWRGTMRVFLLSPH